MIPERFVAEYPARCLALLDRISPEAEAMDLKGTFAIMMASSMLTVPFERLQTRHPLYEDHGGLPAALRALAKVRWIEAGWLEATSPAEWRFARIMGDPNEVGGWRDEEGRPSMSEEANTIDRRHVADVLRVLRNALAHGNIIYLNADGREVTGDRVEFLGFLSRYEEGAEQQAVSETYRLVAVRETAFLAFVRAWADWIGSFPGDDDLRAA